MNLGVKTAPAVQDSDSLWLPDVARVGNYRKVQVCFSCGLVIFLPHLNAVLDGRAGAL